MATYYRKGKKYEGGIGAWLLNYLGIGEDSKSQVASNFRSTLDPNASYSDYINNMSDTELASFLDNYWQETGNIIGGTSKNELDTDAILQDLSDISSMDTNIPESPDYSDIYNTAQSKINAENDELLQLLSNSYNDQTVANQKELDFMNQNYNNYTNNILGSNFRNNANLQSTVASTMDQSRRNALEAGASAGMQLTENINAIMSVQNKQSQLALDTSNNLAQMLVNQQSAASGIRQNQQANQSNYANSQIRIKQGTAERTENYANSRFNTEQNVYQNDLTRYDNEFSRQYQDNPFADSYRNYQYTK